ncbi:sugar phosphate isomerase/epimerase [Conexibacter sp. CPCC 206217]|uniref:sugar phosphate isomerase/epimerase family protein n=1 Tax=Conexibacter sp. CPCC 206217 TaxID=3064574 RepID=UPI00272561FC|nr:TIM barrel protein [Conexibacter sp. CPCC 206217]MDO8213132.1 TIM barrel protein [Conexibacter sp. CPCC 206217]
MRLGGASLHRPENLAELNAAVEQLDVYGLSTIVAPYRLGEMPDDEALEYGQRAAELDILLGEAHYLMNLMVADDEVRAQRIEDLRTVLRKADLMGCYGVISFAGTTHASDSISAPHPDNFTAAYRARFRDVVLRVLDGLDLQVTKLALEANSNTFFYLPEDVAAFMEAVDHPHLGLHLDQMNMVDQFSYYDTTTLIDTTFELLGDRVVGAHFKDIRLDWSHNFLRLDEVLVGDGVLDFTTLLNHLGRMDRDLPCLCEHLDSEGDYAINFARLHRLADELGYDFVRRGAGAPTTKEPADV